MNYYPNPEKKTFKGLARCYVTSKSGGIVSPQVIDIHPVSGECNLDCRWCIGRKQRKIIEPLPNILNKETIILALSKILDPRWKPVWPSEFHFCGGDSEPLIASDVVVAGIKFLLQRKRIIELITNGLLLDSDEIIETVSRIHKISISLDVTNDSDYTLYKSRKNPAITDGFSRVLENIKKLNTLRDKYETDLKIYVTFVATPKTFDDKEFENCFKELDETGVNHISVRQDINKTYGIVKDLKERINAINEKIERVDIVPMSPEEPFTEKGFEYCISPRLWPTLAADGCLYPCAHTATSQYEPFANLLSANSLIELYYNLFTPPSPNFLLIDEIGCNRICPPVIGSLNDTSTAKSILKDELFI